MTEPHHFQIRLAWPADPAQTAHPDANFSRNAIVSADGKAVVEVSAPTVFGGDASRYNPEELLIMSLAECHMLTYLAITSKKRLKVLHYADAAEGTLAIGEFGTAGKMSMQEVVLHPRVLVAKGSNLEEAKSMHEKAHANCFVANSVNFPVRFVADIIEAE